MKVSDFTSHICIWIDDQIVCIDDWPDDVYAKIAAKTLAKAVPIANPGYEARLHPSVNEINERAYLKPEDVIRFPYMDRKDKLKPGG